MPVAWVGSTESVRTATTDPYTFSHTVGATARGLVLAMIHGTSSTDHAPATAVVTVGGKAMGKVISAADTAGEPGRVDLWFLGHDLPAAGAQTVSIDLTSATTDDIEFVMCELTGDRDLMVKDIKTTVVNAANPSVTLAYGGKTCITIGAFYSGLNSLASITRNGNMSAVQSEAFAGGTFVGTVDRQTTPGTSDFVFSYTAATEDVALAAIAICEEDPSPLRDAILAKSPKAYYRMNEPVGCLTAFDRGPNLLHGVFTGTPTLAVAGTLVNDADTAITFGGNTQDFEVPDNANLDTADIVSVHFLTNSSSGTDRALAFRGTDQWTVVRTGSDGGTLFFQKVGSTDVMHTSAQLPSDGTWRQVVFAKSGTDRAAYMEGVDVTVLDTNQTLVNNAAVMNIGGENTATGYAGTLDEFAIFGTRLSEVEQRMLYIARLGMAPLEGIWIEDIQYAPTGQRWYQPDDQAFVDTPAAPPAGFDPATSWVDTEERQQDRSIAQQWSQPDEQELGDIPRASAPSFTWSDTGWDSQQDRAPDRQWATTGEAFGESPATPPSKVGIVGGLNPQAPWHYRTQISDPTSSGSSALAGIEVWANRQGSPLSFDNAQYLFTVAPGTAIVDDYWGDVADYIQFTPFWDSRYWFRAYNAEGLRGAPQFNGATWEIGSVPWQDWDASLDRDRTQRWYSGVDDIADAPSTLGNAPALPLPASWAGWDAQSDRDISVRWNQPQESADLIRPQPVVDASTVAQRAAFAGRDDQQDRATTQQWYAEPAEFPQGIGVEWDPSLALSDLGDHSFQQARSTYPQWHQPDEQSRGDIPRPSAPTVLTAPQLAGLWPEQPQHWQDQSRYQSQEVAEPIRSLVVADASTVAQRAAFEGRDDQQDRGIAQRWYSEPAEFPQGIGVEFDPSLRYVDTFDGSRQQDRSIQPTWFRPDDPFVPRITPVVDVSTVAQRAGIWYESPQHWLDRTPWISRDDPRGVGPVLPIAGTGGTVDVDWSLVGTVIVEDGVVGGVLLEQSKPLIELLHGSVGSVEVIHEPEI
jgi:hypothetical protein